VRLPSDLDGNRLAGIGATPNLVRLLPLQNHVIAEDVRQRYFRTEKGLRCESGKKQKNAQTTTHSRYFARAIRAVNRGRDLLAKRHREFAL
jgi:hypothetical protein